jgi:hypothetical protein
MYARTIDKLPDGNKVKFTRDTFVAYGDTITNSIRKISVGDLLNQLVEDELIKICNCQNEHYIDDVYLMCKNCNGKVTLKNKP